MAGLEVVVRSVVFPNIRPQAPRVLPPPKDPTQGFCTIGGGSGKVIDLPHSWTASLTHSEPVKERKRQVDKERVYQADENGQIKNPKNFIDVERMKKLHAAGGDGQHDIKIVFAEPERKANVETIETDVTIFATE